MSRPNQQQHPAQGSIGYLQLPAADPARSAAFYETVFGWKSELTYGSFEAPGVIGQWTSDRSPSPAAGPVVWLCADELWPTLSRVVDLGGTVSQLRSSTRVSGGWSRSTIPPATASAWSCRSARRDRSR